jgi:hypothetical protein
VKTAACKKIQFGSWRLLICSRVYKKHCNQKKDKNINSEQKSKFRSPQYTYVLFSIIAHEEEYVNLNCDLTRFSTFRRSQIGGPDSMPGLVIWGRQIGIGAGSLRPLRFLLPILIPPTAPHSLIILASTLNSSLLKRR